MNYRPEGCNYDSPENMIYLETEEGIRSAMAAGADVEARVSVCTPSHDLIVELPFGKGIIPREQGAIGIAEGTTRDIALISRVNKIVRFKVTSVIKNEDSSVTAFLSRKASQEECMKEYISYLRSGDIIEAHVTHTEHFGAFVDIGCGIPSLIPIDSISVSRISHPTDRFAVGQLIKAIVRRNDDGRIYLSHKELLGTWEENAGKYCVGETVSGIVRSIEDYGIFVELAPNLAGLAEPKPDINVGERVSVYIKSIIPEKMKVKLIIVDNVGKDEVPDKKLEYFVDADRIEEWNYSPSLASKRIRTVFV